MQLVPANNVRFVNFPLIMLSDVVTSPEKGLTKIAFWSLVDYSRHCKRDVGTAMSQLAYVMNRRDGKGLPNDLWRIANHADASEFIEACEDAWTYDEFTEGAIEILQDSPVSLTPDDKSTLIEWDALNGAASFYRRNISDHDAARKYVATCQKGIDEHANKYGAVVLASLPANYFYEMLDCEKNEDSLRMFRMIAAVRSLVGKKNLTGTTKAMIAARMIGAKKPAVADEIASDNQLLRQELKAMQSRKRMDRILKQSDERGFFTRFGHGRQMYLSTTIKDHCQLLRTAKEKKKRRATYEAAQNKATRRDT